LAGRVKAFEHTIRLHTNRASGEIISQKIEYATPWFQVVAKRTQEHTAPYYALRMLDYVSVVAITGDQNLVLVRQYRPAVERFTLELPSGHVETEETPQQAAERELAEECGLTAPEFEFLGNLVSDTGRHENRLWCYFAAGAVPSPAEYVPEAGVERIFVPLHRMPELMAKGDFDHALNLAVLMMAVVKHGPGLLALV
jgi:ADP-ribose pyrophosphatase